MRQELYDELVVTFGELRGISQREAARIIIQAVRDFQENIKKDQEIREQITQERKGKDNEKHN